MEYNIAMSEIRFYHLQHQSLEQALPALLTKAMGTGKRILVKTSDAARMKAMNEQLWTYRENSFLPHGCSDDDFAQAQPIYITAGDENPNEAKVLILTDGAQSDALDDFDLCCEMLNGRDDVQVTQARARWKEYLDAGHDLTYWQQGESGGWEKKT